MEKDALENDPIFSEVQLRGVGTQNPLVPTGQEGAAPITVIQSGAIATGFTVVNNGGIATLVGPLTTKGDLYVYSTAGTRFAVGADDSWLFADSGQATGLNWRTPATGWGTPSSTLSRTTFATYAGQAVSVGYVQAEVQAIDDHVKVLSQRLGALITDLLSKKLIKA